MTNRDRPSDGLTPVPVLFLDDIKNVLKDIDKNTKQTYGEIVRLQEQTKSADKRITTLEEQTDEIRASPHECKRKDSIQAISRDTKELAERQSSIEAEIKNAKSELDEVKVKRDRAVYWLGGLIVMVISGAIGWIVMLTSLKTEVGYIKEQQQEIKNGLSNIQQRIILETAKTRQAIEVQSAAITKERASQTKYTQPLRDHEEETKNIAKRRGDDSDKIFSE